MNKLYKKDNDELRINFNFLKEFNPKNITWESATKWYFFPLIQFFLAIIAYIILLARDSLDSLKYSGISNNGIEDILIYSIPTIFLIFIFMPAGLAYIFKAKGWGFYFIMIMYYVFMISSIILISYWKNKKNKILKGLIITLALVILLSFLGCSIVNITF